MNHISSYQLLPLENDKEFEIFVCDIFNHLKKTNSFELYGRKGQGQSGIDICSIEEGIIIQCKHKLISRSDKTIRKELLKDLEDEVKSFLEYNETKNNHFTKFILASTFKDDAIIIDKCINLSTTNVTIEYWSWNKLKSNIAGDLLDKYFSIIKKQTEIYYLNNETINIEIQVDKNKSLTHQIYDYLSIRFANIEILPPSLFVNSYPIQRQINRTYRQVYNLKISDNDLYNVFENFEFTNGKLINNFSSEIDFTKAQYIVEKLIDHNIFRILGPQWQQVKILERVTKKYDKIGQLDRFQYFELLKSNQNRITDNSIENLLKESYYNYRLGDLIKSAQLLLKARKLAPKDNGIINLRIEYNLKNLSKFIETRYWRHEEKQKILIEIGNVSLKNIIVEDIEQSIKDLLLDNSFFKNSLIRLQEYTQKVEEYYYRYIRGGRSSMNFDYEIIYEYDFINLFLSKNYIVFDQYAEYSELVHHLFNSVIASYSIKTGNNRIDSLDDYLLSHFIEYGDRKEMEKYLKRYEVFEITYSKTPEDHNFVQLFKNVTQGNLEDLNNSLSLKDENFQEYFKHKFQNTYNNLLLFSERLILNDDDIDNITQCILKLIANKELFRIPDIDNVCSFFIFKRSQIKTEHFIELIIYTLCNTEYYYSDSFINLGHYLQEDNIILNFNKSQFNNILKKLFPKDDSKYDWEFGTNLYAALSSNHQLELKHKYQERLNKSFDTYLYYLLIIHDIIDYNFNDYFDNYLASINLQKGKVSNPLKLNSDNKRLPILDELLNICFKNYIDTTQTRFNKFNGYYDYYDWLMDIGNFDYSKFNPYWIEEYSTKYYYEKFRSYDILKQEVFKHVTKLKDNRLRRIYYEIFCDN